MFNGIDAQVLDTTPVDTEVLARPWEPGLFVPGNFNPPGTNGAQGYDLAYKTRRIPLGITNNADFNAKIRWGQASGISPLFSSVRVASGGFRVFKTSASQNESGTIKAFYSDRGSFINRNLSELINYYQDD